MTQHGRSDEATRQAAIEAAAARFADEENLPDWASDERMHGMCILIADTFGVSGVPNGRSEVWDEILAAHQAAVLRDRAERIVSQIMCDGSPGGAYESLSGEDLRAALRSAVIAGMKERS